MQYISTRGLESSFSFSDILFEGYAEDGGLYVPAVFPKVDAHTLMTWRGLSYASLAFEVIRLFAEELPKEDLWQICSEAYQAGNFGHTRGMFTAEEITPVKWLHDQVGLLELSNGPTLAFDDIALQFMSRLFDTSFAQGRPRTLLGATTGDMGAAAEAAFGGHKNIKVVMLSPKGRMSQFQAAQLYSNQDPNVVNIEVNGTFDECQDIVRTILEDREYAKAHGLGAINSVLWARIVPQIVYYFYGYLRAVERVGEEVVFAVPGGNFGNAYACWVAKKMGASDHAPSSSARTKTTRWTSSFARVAMRRSPRARRSQRPRPPLTSRAPRASSASSSTCSAATAPVSGSLPRI